MRKIRNSSVARHLIAVQPHYLPLLLLYPFNQVMIRAIRKKVLIALVLVLVLLLAFSDITRTIAKQTLSKASLDDFIKCMGTPGGSEKTLDEPKKGMFDVIDRVENQRYTRIEFKKTKDVTMSQGTSERKNDNTEDQKKDENKTDDGFLVLSLIQSRKSFGGSGKRNLRHYLELLTSLEYPNREQVSLGLLVGDARLFKRIIDYFQETHNLMFNRVVLLHAPFIQDSQTVRGNRHDMLLQRVRRRQLARLRNFLMIRSFHDEQHVLWMDSDISELEDKQILRHFVNSGKDIIVPRVSEAANPDYDLNSWQGTRTEPDEAQAKLMDANEWDKVTFVPEDKKVFHFSTFLKEQASTHKEPDYVFPLDAVGGAFLYVRLEILHQGVVFPAYHAVGTNWRRNEGYDGVETEGLCYVARVMGYSCWGMPNQVAVHAI